MRRKRLQKWVICFSLIVIAILLSYMLGRNDIQRTTKLYHKYQAELSAQRDMLFCGQMEVLTMDQLIETLWQQGNNHQPLAVIIDRNPVFIYPTYDYGDLYQNFYWYGLVWTESQAIFPDDSALTIQPIENGWYVYKLMLPQ